ncbi:MAG: IS1 family transposase [Anaerolineaceae bacterium]|nr:IS1 family transposase [Anaerolineaceae bacterium]
MYRLTREQRAQILNMQIEGVSIRATCRLTGRSKGAVSKLIVEAGQACAEAHGKLVRDLRCEQVQVDELWAFVGMKAKRVPAERRGEFGVGDVWTFTALDPETKLIPTWLIGRRDVATARMFLVDLGRRVRGHFQLTSDGASFYREAAEEAFGGHIDYAQLVKLYDIPDGPERVYSPPVCVASRPRVIFGDPDPGHISTSLVERQNLNIRMSMRRFTRLTNAFSKKVYNLSCATAMYVFHHNYVRPHSTLTKEAGGRPTTPAMAAGLADKPWTMADIVELIEAREETAQDVGARRKDRRR